MSLRLHLAGEDPLFAGHFPGHPILPGVAQLAWVEQALGGSLAELKNVKLRSPVKPGDDLDLVLSPPDGQGWTRFEILRGGQAVSLGVARRGDGLAAPGAPGEPRGRGSAVQDLLPHAPPAALLRELSETSGGERIVCTAEIPRGHPLVRDGAATALLGIEAGAQAAALLEALGNVEGGCPGPRIGYLVGIREASFAVASFPAGAPLRVAASRVGGAPPLSIYEVAVGEPGGEWVKGRVSTYLVE